MVRVADTREPWRSPLLQDAEAGVHADAGQHSNRGISYSLKLTLARPLDRPLAARRAALLCRACLCKHGQPQV